MVDQPNVVLILIEGARSDHLSVFGGRRRTTPFLEEIAAAGVRFPAMFTVAPSTVSAHASLFTGLYSSAHGTHDERPHLGPAVDVLPDRLRAAGYRTAAFCTSRLVSPETGFDRGFDVFHTQRYQNRLADRAVNYGRRASDRLLRRSDAGGRRTNEALREWLAEDSRPFFAFVHYDEPRLPLRLNLQPEPGFEVLPPARLSSTAQDLDALWVGKAARQDEDLQGLAALYDIALRYVDARIAEVAAMLRERNAWDDTLVVVTADHGQSFGEGGVVGDVAGLHDSLLRVPLLLRCPGRIPQGFVVDEIAQTVDVAPTILAALGMPLAGPVQGRPLFAEGRATPGPEFAVAERFRPEMAPLRRRFPDVDTAPWDVRMKAVRSRTEKFVWRSDERNEYYDLRTDPGETANRVAEQVERADALRRQLFDWYAAHGELDPTPPIEAQAAAGGS